MVDKVPRMEPEFLEKWILSKLILGVDPGFSGALAIYDCESQKLKDVIDMPLVCNPKLKSKKAPKDNRIDAYGLSLWLENYSKEVALAVIEDVGPRPKEGVSSVFKFGYGAGIIAGIVASSLITTHLTSPAVWKMIMNLTSDKRLSCKRATELFPEFAGHFKRVKDNGRAEAALIAKFGERLLPVVGRISVARQI